MEGQGCSLIAACGDFQDFLEDFQQLLEEFQQPAEGLWVDCLGEGFVKKNPFESVVEQGGDGRGKGVGILLVYNNMTYF